MKWAVNYVDGVLGQKTFKREMGVVAFVILMAVVLKLFFFTPVSELDGFKGILEVIMIPILTFCAATAGLHIWKNTRTGETVHSKEPPARQKPVPK